MVAMAQGFGCKGEVRFRPKPARRVSPKLPNAQLRLLAFRIYEAAVRDLQQPAINGPSILFSVGPFQTDCCLLTTS